MAGGRLITIEGIDGAGKTTLAEASAGGAWWEGCRRPAAAGAGRRRGRRARPRAREGPRAPDRGPRRGVAVRGGEGPARRGGDRPAARAGNLGAARPLRRLLARLPGCRPRARHRRRARDQRVRDQRAPTRPHAAAGASTRAPGASARRPAPSRSTGSRPSRTSSSSGSPRRISSSPPRTRSGSGRSTPTSLRTMCSRPLSRSSPTYSE